MTKLMKHHAVKYLSSKLVGAGFSLFIFSLLMMSFLSLNLFQLSEYLSSPWIWFAFYGYAILASLIIDGIINLWPQLKSWTIGLYVLAGSLVFILLVFQMVFFIIAALIGILTALLFYYGATFVAKNNILTVVFALIIPLLFISVANYDFTKKRDWEEVYNETSFQAEFSYFNGEYKIPIKLQQGESIVYHVHVSQRNYGGWGNHFENNQGKYMPMKELDNERLSFTTKDTGTYYIVVRGDGLSGRIVVDWDIN